MSIEVRGNKVSRRGVLAVTLAIAILMPAAAAADPPTLRGKLATGGTVAFELKRKADGTRKIVRWRWRNLPITCDSGAQTHRGEFYRPWTPVMADRSFHEKAEPKKPRTGFAEVYGQFTTWRRATGTFQVSGDTSAGSKCDSGVVSWSAKRV